MIDITVIELKSVSEKSRGVIGRENDAVFFTTRFGIHTYFMKNPIDVVVMDNDFIVKSIKEKLEPNKIYFWNPLFKNIIELPSGHIKSLKMKKGSRINLVIKNSW